MFNSVGFRYFRLLFIAIKLTLRQLLAHYKNLSSYRIIPYRIKA